LYIEVPFIIGAIIVLWVEISLLRFSMFIFELGGPRS